MQDILQSELEKDSFSSSLTPNTKNNNVAYMFINRDYLCTVYTDLTGRFPCKSSSGNEYVLVAYHCESNSFIAQALKNRRAETITVPWQVIHNMYTQGGIASDTYVMDNENSTEFITALTKNDTSYQLVPPHTHRRNLAERAIQTFKTI